jgi:hypothetical protein
MNRVNLARLLSLAAFAVAAGCSGGGSTAGVISGGDFVVLKTEPSDNATLFLNDPIRIDFSSNVDLDSVDLTTFSFQVLDQVGNTVAEPVAGKFELSTSPGDAAAGRRLLFVPRLPTNDLYDNGGFRPGRTYVTQLVGGNQVNGTVLRNQIGKALAQPRSFRFVTADGTTPAQLFRNTLPGGPRRVGFEVTPTPDQTGVVLNKLGLPPVEIRLQFDQPLNPSATNVPVNINLDPLARSSSNRGRIFLQYDDVTLSDRWIPAEVELESNTTSGSTVVLRPLGVLPNNATIEVVVLSSLEDISGESNVSNTAYEPVFGTFRTKRSYEQQFDSVVDDFVDSPAIDLTAAFAEPLAEVGPGYIKAGFAFEGSVSGAEFEPEAPLTVLNTDFTQVTPKNGAPYNVSGGVFNFKSVKIPSGKTVQGQGSNPMVWLVSESFEVAGLLSVRGGDGIRVGTTGNANVPKPGGVGVCGGGDGGAGSPSAIARDSRGATGNGPRQLPAGGGVGGLLSCTAGCGRGSGGGGGGMATQGDPNFKLKIAPSGTVSNNVFPIFQQQTGVGGNGCTGDAGSGTRNLQGSGSGPLVFVDSRNDNNFWGVGVRFGSSPLRILGELAVPVGGSGGGGGGDLSYNSNCSTDDVNFANDFSGGPGGGGGGVLVVKALGPIIIAEGGRITADGGNGGAGESSGLSNRGGGGGGGAGGMVVLMSATRIEINARGAGGRYRYGNPVATDTDTNNYDFSISADGGVCTAGSVQAPVVGRKYVSDSGTAIPANFRTTYDATPLGGFGGMGIVQLMAPPGTNADNTNTVLDDNIVMIRGGGAVVGNLKRDLIAWRGFPNQAGQGIADALPETPPGANVITIGDNEGDIRPSPILLPTPFAGVSRLRSRWIDTGASRRRALLADDNLPRGIVEQNGALAGPTYEFGGIDPATGYASYALAGSLARSVFATAVAATPILRVDAAASLLGKPAYRVELTTSALGSTVDRYTHYEAQLLNDSDLELGSFRILSHSDRELFLGVEAGPLPTAATRLVVRAKFFDLVTNGIPGPGPTYTGSSGARVPVANVRIGFAFHTDPSSATGRYPAQAGTFAYDLSDPVVQENIRLLGAQFVQWDILFDTRFRTSPSDVPPALSPATPRPQLNFLRLPYRF